MTMRTGLVWHERYMWHDTGNQFGPLGKRHDLQPIENLENPEGKRRIKNLMDVLGLTPQLVAIAPRPATEDELARAHTREHIARVKAVSDAGGGQLAKRYVAVSIGDGGFEIAALSAGGCLALVEAVLDGRVTNGYALVRPPGHHAEPDEAMGFCIFANAAIAGLHALDARGLKRIAVVDWDAHHGNGTQRIFWTDRRALTISLHQARSFPPDTGEIDEIGEGAGRGTNVNVPLPPGSGVGAYRAAFERVVIPALDKFRPELILVASGFDASGHDPLARLALNSSTYRWMTERLMDVAARHCRGRLAIMHEGGYAPHLVPFLCLAVIEQLSGISTGVVDPFDEIIGGWPYQELQTHQEKVLTRAEDVVRRHVPQS